MSFDEESEGSPSEGDEYFGEESKKKRDHLRPFSNSKRERKCRHENESAKKQKRQFSNKDNFEIVHLKKNSVLPLQQDRCWMCCGTGNAAQGIMSSMEKMETGDGDSLHERMAHDGDLCPICWTEKSQYGLATTCTHLFCSECIPMYLTSIKQSGDFPAYCPVCKDSCPAGETPRYGRITGKALAFLRSVGLVDLEFQVQFMRLQNGDQDHYFKCPSPTCQNILVDQDPVKVLRDGKQAIRSVEKCPCGVGVCLLCHSMVNDGEEEKHDLECPMQKRGTKKKGKSNENSKSEDDSEVDDSNNFDADIETKQMMKKLGKKCPNCSMFIMKNEGCDIMMCGDKAHGDLRRAIRNGGCGQQFRWSTMEKISANIIGPNGERISCDPPVKFATEIALLKKQYGILHTDKEEELIRAAEASGEKLLESSSKQTSNGARIHRVRRTAPIVFKCAREGNALRLMRTIENTRRADTQGQQNGVQERIWIGSNNAVVYFGARCGFCFRANFHTFYSFLSVIHTRANTILLCWNDHNDTNGSSSIYLPRNRLLVNSGKTRSPF